jgi:predicted metalloprotease with PDZ domain
MTLRSTTVGAAALALAVFCGAGASAQSAAPLATSLAAQDHPMTIILDETRAPLGVAYTKMTIPVKPGPFTVVYPQWIPGEHGPTGPLHDLSELTISANGKPISWSRDQVNLYAFHFVVPTGVTLVDARFTVLLNAPGDTMSTPNIMIGNWNRYLVYQQNIDNTKYFVKASLIMPHGWDFASALPVAGRSGDRVDFETVSLETLVDSPTDTGKYVKHLLTWDDGSAKTYLDLFADKPEDLDLSESVLAAYKRVTPEALALYGGRHWNVYHSELSLSDSIGFQGIEHHQSSDDRAADDFMTNPDGQLADGDLLTHEFSHSWNGKYRRPFDLQQPNYNTPEHTELLWVYEGMNQYLGDLLSFRAGIRDPKDYPEYFASLYARMAYETGRNTTSLIDLTTGAPHFYLARGSYPAIRRSAGDFYTEGELLWVDADTIIREQSHGEKSLDDFLHVYAGEVTGPKVVTYTRGEIEEELNSVVKYDWHGFFEKYVYAITPEPPTDEIARAGYKLVWNNKPNTFESRDYAHANIDAWYGAGLAIAASGQISDVRENSTAWAAGFTPGMKILAVNDREFNAKVWASAITAAKTAKVPIALLIQRGTSVRTIDLNYHDGLRFPHLERVADTPDMFMDITRPHAR